MKNSTYFKKNFAVLGLVVFALVLTLFVFSKSSVAEKSDAAYKFNEKGELIKPEGYREWIFVGTPVTPNGHNCKKCVLI